MSSVLKKTRQSTVNDLLSALSKFAVLLRGQEEDDAVAELDSIKVELQKHAVDSHDFQVSIKRLLETYDGDHELRAYTLRRKRADDDWTEAEELYLVSIEVLNLANRLAKSDA